MKYALISPTERVYYNGAEIGCRVAEVRDTPFDVHPSLFWIECPDEAEQDLWFYDESDSTVKVKPIETPVEGPVDAGSVVY